MANLDKGQSLYSDDDDDTEANIDVVDLPVVMNIELLLFLFFKSLLKLEVVSMNYFYCCLNVA